LKSTIRKTLRSQALPLLIGLPSSHYITAAFGGRSGLTFSGVFILLGSGLLFLINLHKHRLRRERHNRRHLPANQSVHSTLTKTTSEGGDSYASPELGAEGGGGRLRSSASYREEEGEEEEEEEGEEEEEDMELIPALAQFSNQQCLLQLLDDYNKVRRE
jgi:hypothetical protein